MEAVKLVAVFLAVVLVLVQVVGALSSPLSNEDPDGGVWTLDTWKEYPLERGLSLRLAEIIKRSQAQQFHGLMGRSSGASRSVRLGRKREYMNAQRNKGEMFVGLMGRRSLGEEMKEDWDSY